MVLFFDVKTVLTLNWIVCKQSMYLYLTEWADLELFE